MSDSDSGEIKTTNNKSALDDELDYEEDEENEKKQVANREKAAVKESDGEIDDDDEEEKRDRKSHYRRKDEKEEGEEEEEGEESGEDRSDDEGGRKRGEREKFAKRNDDDVVKKEKEKEEVLSEEEGEINDGERVKKAFIPRVLCKYYQRGKCSWGRGCKFLHPGVNDTGNYSFLEFQDPNAKVFQQAQAQQQQQQQQQSHVDPDSQDQTAASDGATVKPGAGAQPASIHTESAWERGLRHAKEMKERAMRRKQMEKDQFDDKKMNLSLKDFENEKENDERYINAERSANADEDQEEDEEILMYAASSRLNRPGNQDTTSGSQRDHDERNIPYSTGYNNRQSNYRQPYDSSDRSRGDSSAQSRSKPGPSTSRGGPEQRRPASPPQRGGKSRADEWHDPWDKSRLAKKPSGVANQRRSGGTAAEPNYSSSESDSRSGSRSRSRSRSSYSSKSSYSSRSSSYSDRSNSPAQRGRGPKRGQDAKAAVSRSNQNQKAAKSVASAVGAGGSSKALPGRGVPDLTLKKANIAGVKKRSRSNSSASSYSSSASASSDEDGSKDASEESTSESESDSDANEDEDLRKPSKKTVKSSTGVKRSAAKDSKTASNVKKPKVSNSPPRSKDKKQLIKDQLKLLESALKKKAMSK